MLPGLIAFAVDITTGCIYLPVPAEPQEVTGLRRIRPWGRRQRDYEVALAEATGLELQLDDPRIRYLTEDEVISADRLAALVDAPPAARQVRLETDGDGAITGFELAG